jgi:hypothetical protein
MRLAESIVQELGSLALAMSQAGAFMAKGVCPIYNFLENFWMHRTQLLIVSGLKSALAYGWVVYATWDISYAAIQRTVIVVSWSTSEARVEYNAIDFLNMPSFLYYKNMIDDIIW